MWGEKRKWKKREKTREVEDNDDRWQYSAHELVVEELGGNYTTHLQWAYLGGVLFAPVTLLH